MWQLWICISLRKIGRKEKDWLNCVPLMESEKRLPSGKLSANYYSDHEGKSWDREEYILKYGVDPEIYLKWRDRGSRREVSPRNAV
jgi:hypothetical protein